MSSSSMVSELAPVALYFLHIVQPGNVLIVEEPEAHLHPAMQVEFTRVLVAIANAGVRVIVTTHSEWVLEELSNLVRGSQLSGATDGQPSLNETSIRPDEVGVWLLERPSAAHGSVVREIRLEDAGLYLADFDDVAIALHNRWAVITNEIDKPQ